MTNIKKLYFEVNLVKIIFLQTPQFW